MSRAAGTSTRLCLRRGASGALLAVLAACSTTSASYVDDQPGRSVLKGRIQRVEGLVSEDFRHLADGVAVVVAATGCAVTMQFDDGSQQVIAMVPGSMLVWGGSHDYVVRREPGQPASEPHPLSPARR